MMTSNASSSRHSTWDSYDKDRRGMAGVVWLPNPTATRAVPLATQADEPAPVEAQAHEARFGFAGPDDRAMSLNVPVQTTVAEGGSPLSFDIEFDPENPDLLKVSLMELDQDNFIHKVRQSMSFPARLLAELLSRRKATPQEVASWTMPDED